MNAQELQIRLRSYFNNKLSRKEMQELLRALAELEEHRLSELVDSVLKEVESQEITVPVFRKEWVFQQINDTINQNKERAGGSDSKALALPKNKGFWSSYPFRIAMAVASAILLVLGMNEYRIRSAEELDVQHAEIQHADILLPESDETSLILANGTSIPLGDLPKDTILVQAGIKISKKKDGRLYFEVHHEAAEDLNRQHTFKTAKGSSSELVLSDGSVVQLNSASSITFPVVFAAAERRVTLTGEAFFDIARDANKPFRVMTANSQIEVLGTQFNTSAYAGERETKTTLIAGSVLVFSKNAEKKLIPGHQAVVSEETGAIQSFSVETNAIIAWKKGYFRFDDQSIESVLNELTRWYDIQGFDMQVTSSDRFTGSIKRSRKLSDVLHQLQSVSTLKFEIQEGRVIVMK